jgi:hypothetical protein
MYILSQQKHKQGGLMPKPRKQLVSLDATPYYHCTSRCVRRAFLCGTDALTGQCYEHRRQWVEDRILELGQVFAIDVCAYAVMSNHHHVVLHVDKPKTLTWSEEEVCERWHRLYSGTPLTQKYLRCEPLSKAELEAVADKLTLWRERLCDISWFMRALNEPIARQANAEDSCTGRFWESRFASQALLDGKALAACMAYVDLNPVRAKMATSPETSEHTSIKARIAELTATGGQPDQLMPFVGNPREPMPHGLPFGLQDYIELVDWSGRIIRKGKRGAIAENIPPILERLDIDPKHWQFLITRFESRLKTLVGCAARVRQAARKMEYQRAPGLSACRALFS